MTAVQQEMTARKMEPTRSLPVRTPATDIFESEQGIVLVADMPGVSEKGLEVTLENNVLTLVGNNKIFSDNIQNFTHNPFRRVELKAQLSGAADWSMLRTSRASSDGLPG